MSLVSLWRTSRPELFSSANVDLEDILGKLFEWAPRGLVWASLPGVALGLSRRRIGDRLGESEPADLAPQNGVPTLIERIRRSYSR